MGGNERDKVGSPAIDSSSDSCGFEGMGTRPLDCPNNPWRYPENHRPAICAQCPGNPNIWRAASEPLPLVYIGTKQGKGEILPKPRTTVDYEKDIDPSGK
ncbi:MAG: hypothetical protein M1372_00565 [Patescibacteria group bacterium]|nr:hypothetical protein [Patescibacteria group bacterium]